MKIMLSCYLDNNLGDDLMIELLAQKFKDLDFYVFTQNSIVKESFSEIQNLHVVNKNIYKVDVKQFDGYLKIGGSMFIARNLGQIRQRLRELRLLYRLKKANIWTASLGSNYGPFNRVGKFLVSRELKKYDLLTVRDEESKKMLNEIKVKKEFYQFNDIVYSLGENQELKKVGLAHGRTLGISPYRSSDNSIATEEYKSLALIADKFIEKTCGKVKLFAFDTENENDLVACFHVKKFSKYSQSIEIVPYLGQRNTILNSIKSCTDFLAIRFHAAVLAENYNIPFFPIAYSNKMNSLIKDKDKNYQVIQLIDIESQTEFIASSIINGENMLLEKRNTSDSKKHFEVFKLFLERQLKKD